MLSPVSMAGERLVLARWPNVNASNGRNAYTVRTMHWLLRAQYP
jgi:hypothetical protein